MFLYLTILFISLLVYFKLLKRPKKLISGDRKKYVFITGCDSGFGRTTAIQLDSLGFSVFASCLTDDGELSLRNCCSKNLDVIRLDVTDSSQVKAAYDYVRKNMSSDAELWSVINNAGLNLPGPLDWQNIEDMKKVADVNLWGVIDVTKTFLPLLKRSGGRLVNVSSIGGRTSLPYIGLYCSTKFAVEAFTDALRIELCHWNMKVILVEPGFFKTNMTSKQRLISQLDGIWAGLPNDKKQEYGEEFMTRTKDNLVGGIVDTFASSNVQKVIHAIVDAVTAFNPKLRYMPGWDASLLWIWISRLPTSIGDALMHFLCNIQVPASLKHRQ